MAGEMTFKVTFNEQILKMIEKAPTEALNRLAEHVTAGAKRRSPYKTGNNRKNIDWDAPRGGVRRIGPTSGYGGFLEVGTRYMAARPYIRPALEDVKRRAATILKGLVK